MIPDAWWRMLEAKATIERQIEVDVDEDGPLDLFREHENAASRREWQEFWSKAAKCWVTADMVRLCLTAAGDLPDVPFRREQLPWPDGFVVLARLPECQSPAIMRWTSRDDGSFSAWCHYLLHPEIDGWVVGGVHFSEGRVFAEDVEDEDRQDWRFVPTLWAMVQQRIAVQSTLRPLTRTARRQWERTAGPVPTIVEVTLRKAHDRERQEGRWGTGAVVTPMDRRRPLA